MDVFPSKPPPFGRSIIQPLCALAFLAVRKAAFSCLHHFARIVNWRILKINEFCKFTSTDKTMMTLSSPFNPLAWNAVVMASAKKQIHREESRTRRRPSPAPHRWHGCLRYVVYWVRKISAT